MHWTFSNTVPLGSFFILINATGCIRKNMDITKSSIEHSVQQSMWKNFRWSNKTRIELLDEVFKRIQCAFDSNKNPNYFQETQNSNTVDATTTKSCHRLKYHKIAHSAKVNEILMFICWQSVSYRYEMASKRKNRNEKWTKILIENTNQ